VAPVDEVAGHGVAPRDLVAPDGAVGVVLVEEVVPTLVVHRACVCIFIWVLFFHLIDFCNN